MGGLLIINQCNHKDHGAYLSFIPTGNFAVFETLRKIHQHYQSAFPRLNACIQDDAGNTLLHLAATLPYNRYMVKAVEMLMRQGVNPNLRNKDDKTAIQCLPVNKKEDRRAQYIKLQGDKFPIVPSAKKNAQSAKKTTPPSQAEKRDASAENGSAGQQIPDKWDDEPARSSKVSPGRKTETGTGIRDAQTAAQRKERDAQTAAQRKERSRKSILSLIKELPDFLHQSPDLQDEQVKSPDEEDEENTECSTSMDARRDQDDVTVAREKLERPSGGSAVEAFATDEIRPDLIQEDDAATEDYDPEEEEDTNVEIESGIFDNLEWEVECTADVWKILRDRRTTDDVKHRVINKVQLLAMGEWGTSLCKKLGSVPPHIQLYEAKISKGSR